MKHYLIWDLPTRIFHWGLVLCLLGLWYTAESEGEYIDLHMKLGYVVIGLLCFRLIWGIIGTRHARFMSFVPTPTKIKAYVKRPSDYPGHNPLGALMVFALLALVLVQASTGLFIDDDIFSAGPYNGVLSSSLESLMNTIHHNGFDLILIAAAIHILAVAYYWRVKGKNLVKPMLTGKKSEKDVRSDDAINHSKLLIALFVVVVVALFVYWLVVLNAPVVEEFYY